MQPHRGKEHDPTPWKEKGAWPGPNLATRKGVRSSPKQGEGLWPGPNGRKGVWPGSDPKVDPWLILWAAALHAILGGQWWHRP